MGVIKQGILGGVSGKVGNVVGTSWKGIAVLKSLPLSVANPKTPAQVAQRGAMSSIVEVARLLLASILQPYWNPFAQRMSGYNAFVKENIATFTTAGFAEFADFFSQRGSLINLQNISGNAVASTDSLTIDWEDNTGVADALASDESVIVYYNATQDYWGTGVAISTRDSEESIITDTVMAASDVLHCYVGCSRANISKVSDSFYKQITVS